MSFQEKLAGSGQALVFVLAVLAVFLVLFYSYSAVLEPAATQYHRGVYVIITYILVFLIYYIRFLGRHSWPVTMSISIGAPVVTFFFFDVAMRIVLPKGYLEPLFLPLYDIFL